jgi:hypothetical protein
MVDVPEPAAVDADPVLARREQVRRLVVLGKRVGYLALGVAIVGFLVGMASGLPSWTVPVVVVGFLVSAFALVPSIIFGYAVSAAERDEREQAARRR